MRHLGVKRTYSHFPTKGRRQQLHQFHIANHLGMYLIHFSHVCSFLFMKIPISFYISLGGIEHTDDRAAVY